MSFLFVSASCRLIVCVGRDLLHSIAPNWSRPVALDWFRLVVMSCCTRLVPIGPELLYSIGSD
eukprot:1166698-Amorphochlora_amoeboformis.AAC.1